MDDQGFVSLDELMELLRAERNLDLNREEFVEQLDDPNVERFERRGDAVRASYGHSIDVDLDYPEINPEFPLYHGTSPEAWESIREEGLRPMSRQYVHLSNTRKEARRVGYRHTQFPVLLAVELEESNRGTFYRAGPVVLTRRIPPDGLTRIEEDEHSC